MENEFLRGFILGFLGSTSVYFLIEILIDKAFDRFFDSCKKVLDNHKDDED